jgi:hypothetical protein
MGCVRAVAPDPTMRREGSEADSQPKRLAVEEMAFFFPYCNLAMVLRTGVSSKRSGSAAGEGKGRLGKRGNPHVDFDWGLLAGKVCDSFSGVKLKAVHEGGI